MKKAENLLKRLGIAYSQLTEEQINSHKQAWVYHLIPPEKQSKAIDCYCLPSEDGYSDYLWHAFSYGLLNALHGEEAKTALQSILISEAILLSNWMMQGAFIF